jgi:hypothetical protein
MNRRDAELFVCAAIGVAVLGVPLGIGIWRSQEDDVERQQDYACILSIGERCP